MSLLGFLILLIIAGICGALAEALLGFSPGGFMVSIAVGLIGAYLGTWLARQFELPGLLPITVEGSPTIDVVWTVIGAFLLLGLIYLLRGGRTGRRRYWRR